MAILERAHMAALRCFTLLLFLSLGACSGGVEEHLENADKYLAQGQLREAVIELKNVLQKDAEHSDARWKLGNVYLQLGQGAAATKEIRRARDLGYKGSDLQPALLRALLLQGKFKEVLGRLGDLQDELDEKSLNLFRAQAYLGLNQLEKSRAAFNKTLKLNPKNTEAQRGLAIIALSQRKFEEAEKQLDRTLEVSSKDVQAWLLKGELEFSQSRFEAAQSAFQEALKLSPNNAGARLGLARSFLALENTDGAEEQLAVLTKASPKHPLVNYLRAVAAQQRRDIDSAQQALREVLSVQPNHMRSLLLMGAIHYEKREFDQASSFLERFVTALPGHVSARKLLAAVQMEQGRSGEAVATLLAVTRPESKDPQLLALLGSAYMSNRNFAKGAEYLEKAAALAPNAAAIRTQLAISHLATGSAEQAVSELKSAVELDPKFHRADMLLIFTHLRNRDFDKALDAAQILTEKQPDNPIPWNLMGAAFEGKKDRSQARQQYQKALEINPDYVGAALNLARMELQGDNREAAQKRYEAIISKHPTQTMALMGLARIYGKAGDIEKGIELLQQARRGNPKSLQPRLMLVAGLLQRGAHDEVLVIAEEARKLAPENPVVLLNLGRAQLANGKRNDALATFRGLTERYPDEAEAHFHLALAQSQTGDAANTRASLEKTLQLAPDNLTTLIALGNLELRTGRLKESRLIAKKIRKLAPKAAAGHLLEGDINMVGRQPEKALTFYQKALTLQPAGTLAIRRYHAQRAAGDAATAYKGLGKWLQEHPEDQRVRLSLASIDQIAGRDALAIAHYEKLLTRHPKHIIALNNLAWLYQNKGDQRALDFARQAHELLPKRAEIVDTYGWLLVLNGKVEQGLGLLRRAVELAPGNPEIGYHFGAALAQAGDKTAAREALSKALAIGKDDFRGRDEAQKLLEKL